LTFQWAPIPLSHVTDYFTKQELSNIGFNHTYYQLYQSELEAEQQQMSIEEWLNEYRRTNAVTSHPLLYSLPRQCDRNTQSGACCLGSKSSGGAVGWDQRFCQGSVVNYFQRLVPIYPPEIDNNQKKRKMTLYNMVDVIRILNGTYMVIAGDSVMSQVSLLCIYIH
jgi:hypothetical protein